jgi:Arc-like DNA binding domain
MVSLGYHNKGIYMSTSNFNLRGVPNEVMLLLKKKAREQKISTNSLILKIVEEGIGTKPKKKIYHDLDELAGSWSLQEGDEFEESTKIFEQIDKDLWM